MKGLSEGRIVHYVLSVDDVNSEAAVGRHRPAIITNVLSGAGELNLVVYLDGPERVE